MIVRRFNQQAGNPFSMENFQKFARRCFSSDRSPKTKTPG